MALVVRAQAEGLDPELELRAAAEPRDDWHADDSLALARALHP